MQWIWWLQGVFFRKHMAQHIATWNTLPQPTQNVRTLIPTTHTHINQHGCKALNHSNWPNQGAFGHSHTNRWTDAQTDMLNFLSAYIQIQQAYNLYCTYAYSLQPLGILHTYFYNHHGITGAMLSEWDAAGSGVQVCAHTHRWMDAPSLTHTTSHVQYIYTCSTL